MPMQPSPPTDPAAVNGAADAGNAELAELALALIDSRFSVAPKHLRAPGPSPEQLQQLVAFFKVSSNGAITPAHSGRASIQSGHAPARKVAGASFHKTSAAAPSDADFVRF